MFFREKNGTEFFKHSREMLTIQKYCVKLTEDSVLAKELLTIQ